MKILIIQRDNIGDLILTTPLISSLSRTLGGKVDLLVNTYNQKVLENNPHVGKVHPYSKLHHRQPGQSLFSVLFQRVKSYLNVRNAGYDVAIIARGEWSERPLKWARLSGAKRIIAIGNDTPPEVSDPVTLSGEQCHIVELFSRLAVPLGVTEPPAGLELYPTREEILTMRERLPLSEELPVFGIQISSRKPEQRWPAEKFIRLMHEIASQQPCQFLLFWSPGAADNKSHPGDDDKARQIIEACPDIALIPAQTRNLRELIAGMSLCQQILTSDGGALHVAAGVQVPTVALFGNSDAWFWGPWKVPSEILEAPGQDVSRLEVEVVVKHFMQLRQRVVAADQATVVAER